MKKQHIHNLFGFLCVVLIAYGLWLFWGVPEQAFYFENRDAFFDKFFVRFDFAMQVSLVGAVPCVLLCLLFMQWFKVDAERMKAASFYLNNFFSLTYVWYCWGRVKYKYLSLGALESPFVFFLLVLGTPVIIFSGIIVYSYCVIRLKGQAILKAPLETVVRYFGTTILQMAVFLCWIIVWLFSCHVFVNLFAICEALID